MLDLPALTGNPPGFSGIGNPLSNFLLIRGEPLYLPSGSPSLQGCSASNTLKRGTALPYGAAVLRRGLACFLLHCTGPRETKLMLLQVEKRLTEAERGSDHLWVRLQEGLGEFPSLGIPKNGQRRPMLVFSAHSLGQERREYRPSLSKSGTSRAFSWPFLGLHTSLSGLSSHPHPQNVSWASLWAPDEASAPFFFARIPEAGKEQRSIGRWRNEHGYEFGIS